MRLISKHCQCSPDAGGNKRKWWRMFFQCAHTSEGARQQRRCYPLRCRAPSLWYRSDGGWLFQFCGPRKVVTYLSSLVAGHLYDGDAHIAANTKRDEKAQGRHEGDGVALRYVARAWRHALEDAVSLRYGFPILSHFIQFVVVDERLLVRPFCDQAENTRVKRTLLYFLISSCDIPSFHARNWGDCWTCREPFSRAALLFVLVGEAFVENVVSLDFFRHGLFSHFGVWLVVVCDRRRCFHSVKPQNDTFQCASVCREKVTWFLWRW